MLHRVDFVRTEVSDERIAPIIRVTKIGELGAKLAGTSNRSALRECLSCVSDFSLSVYLTKGNLRHT
jgi:hypothetical protein